MSKEFTLKEQKKIKNMTMKEFCQIAENKNAICQGCGLG